MKPPIKNFKLSEYPKGSVTQWFGENPDLYRRWGLKYHNGIDIVAPHGSPMFAVEDARVVAVKTDSGGYGKHVRIRSLKKRADTYRCWTYGHCSAIHVKEGQIVRAGEHIADMGNTGFVVSGNTPWWKHNPYAGTHLHLGLRLLKEDPRGWSYRGDNIKYNVQDYDNGVKGAVDPYPYLLKLDEVEETKWKKQALTLISLLQTIIKLSK